MKKNSQRSSAGAEIVEALEGFLEALQEGGDLSERFTVRTVELDLKPRVYTGEDVRRTREILGLSQPLFARFLGVSPRTVRSWEQEEKTPSPMACRFLDEIATAPEHWKERLKVMIHVKADEQGGGRRKRPCSSGN